MKKSEIKNKFLNSSDLKEHAGFKYGEIKKVLIENYGEDGYIAVFYKNCKPFETYKGQDTRPVEIFYYNFDDGQICLDLWSECNGSDSQWIEKKKERISDKDFFIDSI